MTQTAMGPVSAIIIQLRILIKNSPPPSLKKKGQTNQFYLKEYMGIRSRSREGDGDRDGTHCEC